jgi:hypothetical protein
VPFDYPKNIVPKIIANAIIVYIGTKIEVESSK